MASRFIARQLANPQGWFDRVITLVRRECTPTLTGIKKAEPDGTVI